MIEQVAKHFIDITSNQQQIRQTFAIDDDPQYGHSDNDHILLPDVSDEIWVYCPTDDQFYDGTVHLVNNNNTYTIHCDKDVIAKFDLHRENWKFQDNGQLDNENTNQLKVIFN